MTKKLKIIINRVLKIQRYNKNGIISKCKILEEIGSDMSSTIYKGKRTN